MISRRNKIHLLISEQREHAITARKNGTDVQKLSTLSSVYLDDQGKQYSMENEPAELESEVSLIDEPLATSEIIGFQLEREKKKVNTDLDVEDGKLKELGSSRVALDSDGLDNTLCTFFGRINFKSDTQSLSPPVEDEQSVLELKVNELREQKVDRLSSVCQSKLAKTHLEVPLKKMFFKHFKVDIKSINTELINTKLYQRRMNN